MGIARDPQLSEKQEEQKVIVNIIEKVTEPVVVASKKYYQTNPRETLELGLLFCLILMTFIGQLIRGLPWGWYVVLGLMTVKGVYYNGQNLQLKKNARKKTGLSKPNRS